MDNSVFNPLNQQNSISSKIVTGLERISEVFKVLIWEKSKSVGLSPIQIQAILFIAYHKPELCNISHLAKEFNVTKPTISDTIKTLYSKGLVTKDFTTTDQRSYTIQLTPAGLKLISGISDFANPLKNQVEKLNETELLNLFNTISGLIFQLNQADILTVQRTCYGCKFYQKSGSTHYCALLEKKLRVNDIRLDCPEFVEKEI